VGDRVSLHKFPTKIRYLKSIVVEFLKKMHFTLKFGPYSYNYLKFSWAASGSCCSTTFYQGVLNNSGPKKFSTIIILYQQDYFVPAWGIYIYITYDTCPLWNCTVAQWPSLPMKNTFNVLNFSTIIINLQWVFHDKVLTIFYILTKTNNYYQYTPVSPIFILT